MVMPIRLISLLKVSLVIQYISSLALAVPLKYGETRNVPRTFTDDFLPELQRKGELIPNLGRVMLLDTYLSPTSEFRTSFSIWNKRQPAKLELIIQPDTFSTLGLGYPNTEHGPYHFDLDSLLESGYDADKRTVIMIPGYMSEPQVSWVVEARKRWLELDAEANVIEVSWSDSNQCTYSRAAANTILVARQVTIFLHYLAELSGTSLADEQFLKRLHLIGHSLGAHIVGFVGQDLDGKVGRITALDPAGPTFDRFDSTQRLDRRDALLVEVIHTNSGTMKYLNMLASVPLHALSTLSGVQKLSQKLAAMYSGAGDTAWFGMEQQVGHIDYFANNGRVQDGCSGILHICDHKRARDIYLDLLNYELASRRAQTQQPLDASQSAEVKSNRLYAFRADNYDSFASGRNLIARCPELMTISKHLNDDEVLKSFQKCAVPMPELLRPVEEVIEELSRNHGVRFDRSLRWLPFNDSPAYYFKTLADPDNLLGHHYLLKVYLLDEPIWDSDSCTLEAEIKLNDNSKLNIELNQIMHPTGTQQVLAMPFIHRDQANQLARLNKLVETSGLKYSSELADLVQELFPKTITLSLSKPKSASVFGTVRNIAAKLIKSNDLGKCRLSIDMIETHPVVYGQKRNFGALYGSSLFLGSQFNQQLRVMAASEQLELLDDADRPIITLASDSMSSVAVGLEAAIVG